MYRRICREVFKKSYSNFQFHNTINVGVNLAAAGIISAINANKIEETGRNLHLHINFAKRDLVDDKWYYIDPFGIYSKNECYPAELEDPINKSCSRYQVFWKGGVAQYP